MGVTKHVLCLLFIPHCYCISPSQMNKISERVECYKVKWPGSQGVYHKLKATEFGKFLLVFQLLLVFMQIILLESVRENNLVYVKKLAVYCIQESIELYRPSFHSNNVHDLIHFYEDVKYFKEDLHYGSVLNLKIIFKSLKNMYSNQQIQLFKKIKEIDKTGKTESDKLIKVFN